MLRHLHIRNLAIIDELSLDFDNGFSVLTGETGAGKSILIDALGLVTGTRAESGLVRGGCDKAEVAAEFSLEDSP
ncbi:MAG: AAA family ATPase, partial [Nevskia sp.]|nr:AAA family ATPase [Nevskia sp.]